MIVTNGTLLEGEMVFLHVACEGRNYPDLNILSVISLLLIVLFYCVRFSLHTLALLLFDLLWTQAILTADILTCQTWLELTGLSAAALTLDAAVSGSCYCAPA